MHPVPADPSVIAKERFRFRWVGLLTGVLYLLTLIFYFKGPQSHSRTGRELFAWFLVPTCLFLFWKGYQIVNGLNEPPIRMVVGFGIALLFSLLPLLGLRRVSPLLAIRASYEESTAQRRDLWRWLVYFLILINVAAFSIAHTRRWIHGLWFTLGLVAGLGVLTAAAWLVRFSAKRVVTRSRSYIWRQGIANLYRPNNQTLVLMLSIGLGTFLMMTLYLIHGVLVQEVTLLASGHQPNMVLFDIQTDQREDLGKLVRSLNVPILQEVPIVTMRLASVQGRAVEGILKDPKNAIPESALQREYRW